LRLDVAPPTPQDQEINNKYESLIQNYSSELPTPQILKEDVVARTNFASGQKIRFN